MNNKVNKFYFILNKQIVAKSGHGALFGTMIFSVQI